MVNNEGIFAVLWQKDVANLVKGQISTVVAIPGPDAIGLQSGLKLSKLDVLLIAIPHWKARMLARQCEVFPHEEGHDVYHLMLTSPLPEWEHGLLAGMWETPPVGS